jgi:hypothetical protein
LDYLVVRQTDEHKYGSVCREREGSAQIQVCMPTWDEVDQKLKVNWTTAGRYVVLCTSQ